MVNEVLSNALKHAFPDGREGKIDVRLTALADGKGELVVSDNGVGYELTQDSKGIGSKLIRAFVSQLGGESEITTKSGTAFSLKFPTVER